MLRRRGGKGFLTEATGDIIARGVVRSPIYDSFGRDLFASLQRYIPSINYFSVDVEVASWLLRGTRLETLPGHIWAPACCSICLEWYIHRRTNDIPTYKVTVEEETELAKMKISSPQAKSQQDSQNAAKIATNSCVPYKPNDHQDSRKWCTLIGCIAPARFSPRRIQDSCQLLGLWRKKYRDLPFVHHLSMSW